MENMTHKVSIESEISHELRIPLTGILGMAHFLQETPLTLEQKEYVEHILTAANRLLGLESKLFAMVKRK